MLRVNGGCQSSWPTDAKRHGDRESNAVDRDGPTCLIGRGTQCAGQVRESHIQTGAGPLLDPGASVSASKVPGNSPCRLRASRAGNEEVLSNMVTSL